MRASRSVGRSSVYFATLISLALPAQAAPWFRDFNDGTLQGLQEFDLAWLYGMDGFNPFNKDNACRLLFVTGDDTDTAVLFDHDDIFTDTSVKMLIKWPANPILVKDGTRAINVGMFMRATIDLEFYQFKAYVVLMTDEGEVGMVKLIGITTPDMCPEGNVKLPDFDHTKNYWLKGEAIDVPEGVLVRAKAWPEGGEEPKDWQVMCTDAPGGASPIYLSGQIGLGAQEENATDQSVDQSYVDVDDVSAGPAPEYKCYNRVDDDGNGVIDCDDPNCAGTPACTCSDPFADMDKDGDVDQSDFGEWQLCFTGPGNTLPLSSACDCLDRNDTNGDGFFNPPDDGDGVIDLIDLLKFEACASGPAVPAVKSCDG